MKSRMIVCDCGHSAYAHRAGRCGGYVVNDRYRRVDTSHLGGREYSPFCNCDKDHWDVIDKKLNVLVQRIVKNETTL